MRNLKNYKLFSILLALVYFLSACSGVPASSGTNANTNDSDAVVTFAGVVESMGGGQWTISGQVVNVTGTTSIDANIAVGDTVKVEAVIDQGGIPTAVKIEFSGDDDVNSNDDNGNDDNTNDDNGNDDNSNGNTNGNDNSSGDEIEVIGMLDAITATSLTIDGVEYQIDSTTEFKDELVVGDQVKAHVIVNTDGTLTVREIEKFSADDNDNGSDDNSNGNDNSNDDNGNDDNGNDDNSNDDNGNDDNGNDDNGNDDDSDDDDNSNDDNSND